MQSVPVTFYLDVSDKDIASWRALRPDEAPQRLLLGEDYWITHTYTRLRDAGDDVRLDNRVPDTGIVVFYAGHKRPVWRAARGGSGALLVAVRSDRHPVGFADVEVVQNAASADGERAFHVPHWPQPGLRVRDAARGTTLRTLLFPGTPQNLHPAFRSAEWEAFLQARGLQFRCHYAHPDGTPPAWHDYHDVDLMLAVRPSGTRLVRNKPAWKLFNAWLAGVPAILGPESGYRELRASPLDYIEATGVDDTMVAIDRLLAEPALYQAMVDNGRARGQAFTDAATLAAWRRLIRGVLAPAAERQASRPMPLWLRRARELAARVARAWGEKR
ncbi:glycosyltransferase [Lysobacter olei]